MRIDLWLIPCFVIHICLSVFDEVVHLDCIDNNMTNVLVRQAGSMMLSWCGWRVVAVVLWAVAASAAEERQEATVAKGAANPVVQQLERSLLSMFGLQRRPRVKKNVVVPPYMLELYRLQAQLEPTDPVVQDQLLPDASNVNTIRSFTHRGE